MRRFLPYIKQEIVRSVRGAIIGMLVVFAVVYFPYRSSMVLLAVATYLITKKFGLWAGIVTAGFHIINILVDYVIDGNLTTFRQYFYSIYAILLMVAYYKTVNKLKL